MHLTDFCVLSVSGRRDGKITIVISLQGHLSPHHSDQVLGLVTLQFGGYRKCFPWGVKKVGQKVNHSSPSQHPG